MKIDDRMTMADVLDVRQATDKMFSAVKEFNRAIHEMNGDCNSLIVDDYPFPMSFGDWVVNFDKWYHSVDKNCDTYEAHICNTYRHAIRTVRGKDE